MIADNNNDRRTFQVGKLYKALRAISCLTVIQDRQDSIRETIRTGEIIMVVGNLPTTRSPAASRRWARTLILYRGKTAEMFTYRGEGSRSFKMVGNNNNEV